MAPLPKNKQQLEEWWRARLEDLLQRYRVERTSEAKAEYLRELKQFADFVQGR
jgi:hypothetical protein